MVEVGQLWDFVGCVNDPPHVQMRMGRYQVVAPNDSKEAGPDSWEMRRASDGRTAWMHHNARLRGEWEFRPPVVKPYTPISAWKRLLED